MAVRRTAAPWVVVRVAGHRRQARRRGGAAAPGLAAAHVAAHRWPVPRRPASRRQVRRRPAAADRPPDSPLAQTLPAGLAVAGQPVAGRPIALAAAVLPADRRLGVRAAWRAGRRTAPSVPVAEAAPARQTGPPPAWQTCRGNQRPRSWSDDHGFRNGHSRVRRRSLQPKPIPRPAGWYWRCQPSSRWTDRCAIRCRHRRARCTSPALRSSQGLLAGRPGLTRRTRHRGQIRTQG